MKDRVAGAPGQYSATVTGAEFNRMQNGEPFAITLQRDDKPEVEGTPYSKAAVLPDDVAKRLCPEIEDPSPADAFDSLSKRELPVLSADPNTLKDVIADARPGTTIRLAAGTYSRLDLVGVNAYPEGLTIVGCEDAFVAGISITSGLIDPTYITGDNPNMEMPSNLTLKGISLTDGIYLRNCAVNGLNILNCRFHAGNILLAPDSLIDQYGRDTTDAEKTVMWHHDSVKPRIRNVIIDGNVFAKASTNNIIEVNCVDNVEITNNDIREAGYNGIHVNGQSGSYSTGRIAILKNEIRSSVSRSIRIAALKDAELFVHSNGLCNANTNGKSSDYIKVSDCENTTFTWTLGTGGYNTYRENKDAPHRNLVVGEGITLENCIWEIDDALHNVFRYISVNNGDYTLSSDEFAELMLSRKETIDPETNDLVFIPITGVFMPYEDCYYSVTVEGKHNPSVKSVGTEVDRYNFVLGLNVYISTDSSASVTVKAHIIGRQLQ